MSPFDDVELTDALRRIRGALPLNQAFLLGTAGVRVVGANRALQDLSTGRFVKQAALLAQYGGQLKKLILRNLAQEVLFLLEENVESLTSEHLYSLKYLEAIGHPFATKRHPRGRIRLGILPTPGNPAYVSEQHARSGQALSDNFHYNLLSQSENNYAVLVSNPVSHAGYLIEGTDRMIARPFDQLAAQRTQQAVERLGLIENASKLIGDAGFADTHVNMPQILYQLGGVKRNF